MRPGSTSAAEATTTTAQSRRSALERRVPLRRAAEAGNGPCYTIVAEQAVVDRSSTTRPTTTGISATSPSSRCAGAARPARRQRQLDQGRLLPPRLVQARRQRAHGGEGRSATATRATGISSGWVDQYHQATDGQQVDLTGAPERDDYYLVSTTNHTGAFVETNYTNNTAWVKFTLTSDSNGNRKVTRHRPLALRDGLRPLR